MPQPAASAPAGGRRALQQRHQPHFAHHRLVARGLGPLGGAFFLWDAALKRGDARQIGVLSFLTPLLSTLTLLWVRGETPSLSVALAAVMIIGAAVLATRTR